MCIKWKTLWQDCRITEDPKHAGKLLAGNLQAGGTVYLQAFGSDPGSTPCAYLLADNSICML